MKIIKDIASWKLFLKSLPSQNIGLVPTMGGLHQGHRSLIQRSVRENDFTVLSLFVNSPQFDRPEDFDNYPETFDDDVALCHEEGVDCLLHPDYKELYSDGYCYRVCENRLSLSMEGKYRPGHFEAILSVVLKFLMLTKADRCYFGEKDFQQFELCKGMAKAFFLDCEMIACATVREKDGLACSTRNLLLNNKERQVASKLFEQLSSKQNLQEIQQSLENLGFRVDYVQESRARRYAAAYLGKVRLIDNVPV